MSADENAIQTNPLIRPHLKQQISRVVHPEVIRRVARLCQMNGEAALQNQLAALPRSGAAAHAGSRRCSCLGRRHVLGTKDTLVSHHLPSFFLGCSSSPRRESPVSALVYMVIFIKDRAVILVSWAMYLPLLVTVWVIVREPSGWPHTLATLSLQKRSRSKAAMLYSFKFRKNVLWFQKRKAEGVQNQAKMEKLCLKLFSEKDLEKSEIPTYLYGLH